MNITVLLKKAIPSLKNGGIKETLQKTAYYLSGNKPQPLKQNRSDLNAQRGHIFPKSPKVSVIVPLQNTPDRFLREMISSVQAQTYENWELCLADGSDEDRLYAEKTVQSFSKTDDRIKYKKLSGNFGISEIANACIDMASGDYIALLDRSDILHPSALYYVISEINESDADFIYTDEGYFQKSPKKAYFNHFKPDYAPDTLRSYNYIGGLSVFRKELLESVGKFRKECDGCEDYDMILRLTEKANKTVHIPKVLYCRRKKSSSFGADKKPLVKDAAHKALSDHLMRVGVGGTVKDGLSPMTYKIDYDIPDRKKVSVLIPNKDHVSDIRKCIDSILQKTTYDNFEIIVIENGSTEEETFDYYSKITKDSRIKVVTYVPKNPGFNYSSVNNFGEKQASGDYLIFLNNDIEIISPSWIEEMMMYCQREDVGAVGITLCYPDNTVQHAGVILGIGGVAGHSHKHFKRGSAGYASRLSVVQNLSAVTAACMMIRHDVFQKAGGFDTDLAVAFNDIDLCLKIRSLGYLIVFTPYTEAYHHESKSRGTETTPEKINRFQAEREIFLGKWQSVIDKGDPYYNPNLTLLHEDFKYKK